jgi:Flp pilus assembly protein TadD
MDTYRFRTRILGVTVMLGTLCLVVGCQSGGPAGGSLNPFALWGLPNRNTAEDDTQLACFGGDLQLANAAALERAGETGRAIEAYSEHVLQNPDCGQAYHRLAILHERINKPGEAEQYYRAALDSKVDKAQVLCDLGYGQYLQRRLREAESTLREAIKLDPNLTRAHNNLALVLAHTGRHGEARAEFALAGCSQAEALSNLGYALLWNQERDAARRHFDLALQVDPSSSSARRGLALLFESPGSTDRNQPIVGENRARGPDAIRPASFELRDRHAAGWLQAK